MPKPTISFSSLHLSFSRRALDSSQLIPASCHLMPSSTGTDAKKCQVTYFYEPTIGDYYYGQGHLIKPHHILMAHNLIIHYSLHRRMEINRLFLAAPADIRKFHSDDYVEFLAFVTLESLTDPAYSRHLKRFNVGEDCPVFYGLFGFCQAFAGGSIGAAVKLNRGDADIALNWAGGLHHAKKSEASGFCYVNDIMLGILKLLKVHRTAIAVGVELDNKLPYNEYYEYYGPDYTLHIEPSNMENLNSPKDMETIR